MVMDDFLEKELELTIDKDGNLVYVNDIDEGQKDKENIESVVSQSEGSK